MSMGSKWAIISENLRVAARQGPVGRTDAVTGATAGNVRVPGRGGGGVVSKVRMRASSA